MTFFDAHIHVYPEYGMDVLLSSLANRALRHSPRPDTIEAAVMLRSFQPSLAAALESARAPSAWQLAPPAAHGAPWTASRAADGITVSLRPARQVATLERLELLGYFGEAPVPDGLPIKETARRLADAGYTVALAWGRGKWLFRRAAIVRDFLEDPEMRRIAPFVCDSALRPWFWPEPLFAIARRHGFRLLSGSDPLPGAGNERYAGRRAMVTSSPPLPLP